MVQDDFVIRECEECHEEMMDSERRRRCGRCGKLVCGWCFNHIHSLLIGRFNPPACASEKPFGPKWVARKVEENERGYGRKS